MTRDRAIIVVLACIIGALLVRGDTIEAFGLGVVIGLAAGAWLGVAIAYGERPAEEKPEC